MRIQEHPEQGISNLFLGKTFFIFRSLCKTTVGWWHRVACPTISANSGATEIFPSHDIIASPSSFSLANSPPNARSRSSYLKHLHIRYPLTPHNLHLLHRASEAAQSRSLLVLATNLSLPPLGSSQSCFLSASQRIFKTGIQHCLASLSNTPVCPSTHPGLHRDTSLEMQVVCRL